MKRSCNLLFSSILVFLSACKKDGIQTSYSSINIVNAAVGAGTVKVNYFGQPINWGNYVGAMGLINFATNQILTVSTLTNDYPFMIVPALDTLKPVFNEKLALESMRNYTLFITGQASAVYESLFVKETNIPYGYADSAVAVRFINLSPNSPAVNITLASAPTVNVSGGLAFKQLTEFKQFPLKAMIPVGSVTFEVRDAESNAVLANYTIPSTALAPYNTISTMMSRFKSITLVIKGLAGVTVGVDAFGIFPVAQY